MEAPAEEPRHYRGSKHLVPPEGKRTYNVTTSMYPGDIEALETMTAYYGCSRAEAMRSALRIAVAHVAWLEGQRSS